MFRKIPTVKVLSYILIFMVFALKAEAVAPKYPAVREVRGVAWLTGKDGKRLSLRRPVVLREKALLETSLDGEVKVQLDEKRAITLLGAGELAIPVISWESGEAPVVILKTGQLHWQQKLQDKAAYNIALRSDLFEFIAPPGDYVLSIDPSKAVAGVKMFEGSMEFSALNGEDSAKVQSGQQVSFQGVLEGGEITYDILLKGKKIPRGRLTAVTSLDLKELSKASEAEKLRLKKEKLEKDRLAKAKALAAKEGAICQRPSGRFNECSWTCLSNPKKEKKACLVAASGVSCVRHRCNANGEWAEETVLDAEKGGSICKAQVVVGPCDY
ncbi:hypothetical protein EZJ49_11830 [Bdellovibrio bacteriovorus]|uniref:hypothetical protein n=1 Tax=Bdellovibrio bacteriovorus TaxID=959 RepID=UPI0021D20638|nr:hypothetical protein [Bdellovibrio bacteriovorus]UXR63753.1 hypothetical protein EZJ49_11830 [Bdellovibrio bacteriovorus]